MPTTVIISLVRQLCWEQVLFLAVSVRLFAQNLENCWFEIDVSCEDVVSVSTSRSRDGLETHQRLVSVSAI